MSTSLSLAIVVSGQFSVSFALTLEARSRSPQRANSTGAARPSMLHIVCTRYSRARLLAVAQAARRALPFGLRA